MKEKYEVIFTTVKGRAYLLVSAIPRIHFALSADVKWFFSLAPS